MMPARFPMSREQVSDFCRRLQICRLALFGSVLRDDFGPSSDIDVLVAFEPQAIVGMIRLASIEQELTELLSCPVDLNTKGFLSRHFRTQVLAEAEVQYEATG